jgi:hypothetical protein
MSKTAPNTRLPYLCLYVTEHAARVARLSLAERGMLDLVRCELWAVDGFKLPREHLERRLRVRPGTQDADHLQALFDDCLLQVDEQEHVFDEVLTRARDHAIAVSQTKQAAAAKRWDKQRPPSEPEKRPEGASPTLDAGDF